MAQTTTARSAAPLRRRGPIFSAASRALLELASRPAAFGPAHPLHSTSTISSLLAIARSPASRPSAGYRQPRCRVPIRVPRLLWAPALGEAAAQPSAAPSASAAPAEQRRAALQARLEMGRDVSLTQVELFHPSAQTLRV